MVVEPLTFWSTTQRSDPLHHGVIFVLYRVGVPYILNPCLCAFKKGYMVENVTRCDPRWAEPPTFWLTTQRFNLVHHRDISGLYRVGVPYIFNPQLHALPKTLKRAICQISMSGWIWISNCLENNTTHLWPVQSWCALQFYSQLLPLQGPDDVMKSVCVCVQIYMCTQ